MAEQYQLVSENPESTVVAEFEPGYRSAAQYQSEAEMVDDFIKQLSRQAYDYLPIKNEQELIYNSAHKLNALTSSNSQMMNGSSFSTNISAIRNRESLRRPKPFRKTISRHGRALTVLKSISI